MTEETTRAFLRRLWELQAERGLRNADLARALGISASYVSRLKSRPRVMRLGYAIALAAVREFPELGIFLRSDLPEIQEDRTIIKPADEEV